MAEMELNDNNSWVDKISSCYSTNFESYCMVLDVDAWDKIPQDTLMERINPLLQYTTIGCI
jgi:hypothetical protein